MQRHATPHQAIIGLKQELIIQDNVHELALDALIMEGITQYLQDKLRTKTPMNEVAQALFERTGGNALFMVHAVDDLLQEKVPVYC